MSEYDEKDVEPCKHCYSHPEVYRYKSSGRYIIRCVNCCDVYLQKPSHELSYAVSLWNEFNGLKPLEEEKTIEDVKEEDIWVVG